MRRWQLSIIGGTIFTGLLALWAYADHAQSAGHSPPPKLLRWLIDWGAAPICHYLNPSMENENLVCGAPMLTIDVAIYSLMIYAVLWLTGKIKIRDRRAST